MQHFNEDEDFVAVRRPKRKPTEAVTAEPNLLTVQKKRRKSDDKEGKFSDVDFVDRTILRNIRVPKKIKECDDPLQRIDLLSKEFSREVNDVISRHLKDSHALPFEIKACYLIQNRELQKKYAAKRSTLKGEAANHDNFGFCFFREFAAVRELAKNGLRIGNVERSLLGKADNGVSLSQHADAVAQPHQLYGWIIICKYMKGRANLVQMDEDPLEPQPGYECHIPIKNMQAGTAFPAFNYSQVYLYEYSEDFDLIEYPSHVLPIAAVQIAARSVNGGFKKKTSFEDGYRPRPPNPTPEVGSNRAPPPPPEPKILPEPRVARPTMVDLACRVMAHPRCRPGPFHWGTPHSSGGFVAGTCILRIPLSVTLEAETLIISFSESSSCLPLGISTSRMTLNRFIDLEDLYTTIFRDGNVKLSLTKEVHVEDVGHFSYYRIVLKDGCADKLSMINFTNYLKATNKACLMMSHLQDTPVILFPDAPVARDIGLPQPDPMAQPFSLHCVVLANARPPVFYERLAGVGSHEVAVEAKEEHPTWQAIHLRHLRFSFQQQAEAQRACLLQQLDKSARPGRRFEYRPVSQVELSPSGGGGGSSGGGGGLARRSRPKPGEYVPGKVAPYRPPVKEREEEEDDIDDLAVLDSIDRMVLEDPGASKKDMGKKGKKEKAKEDDTQFKEVFREPPASPSAERTSKSADRVPVVPVTSADKAPSNMTSVFSSMKTQIQSLVTTLQSQIGARTPRKSAIEENLESEPGPDEKAQASATEAKTSKDWYWFYHKNQNPGDSGEEQSSEANESSIFMSQGARPSPSYPQPAPMRPSAGQARLEGMNTAHGPRQSPSYPQPAPMRPSAGQARLEGMNTAHGPRQSPSYPLQAPIRQSAGQSRPPVTDEVGAAQGQRHSPSYPQPAPTAPASMMTKINHGPRHSPSYPQPSSSLMQNRPAVDDGVKITHGTRQSSSFSHSSLATHAESQGRMSDGILTRPVMQRSQPYSYSIGTDSPSLLGRPGRSRMDEGYGPQPATSLLGDPCSARLPSHPKSLLGSPGERYRPTNCNSSPHYGPSEPSSFDPKCRNFRQSRSGGCLLPTPSRPARCEEGLHDVDLRTMPQPMARERPGVLNSGQDVDMRRPMVSPRASIYNPPRHRGHNRPASRISTYEPGLGFQ